MPGRGGTFFIRELVHGLAARWISQIPSTKQQTNPKFQYYNVQNRANLPVGWPSGFGHLVPALWNFASGEAAEGRIPQGEILRIVWDLELEI